MSRFLTGLGRPRRTPSRHREEGTLSVIAGSRPARAKLLASNDQNACYIISDQIMAKKFNAPTPGKLRRILVITWRCVLAKAVTCASIGIRAVPAAGCIERLSVGRPADQ